MRADHTCFGYGATLGFLADLALGDPRHGHPVAAFGRAAGAVERHWWRDHRGRGALYTALCAGGATAAAALSSATVRALPGSRALQAALTAAATWAALGGTTLGREARAVAGALDTGDLAAARELLPRLCGRDPQALDGQQIARAVVESVAENTSDAVVGALLWGAVCGVPGLVGFRAVNTLDAMVGHKSARHRRFGWASARLDDVAGWPGARLTATLATVAGPDPRGAWRAWRRDGGRHPSPNAGPVEAAFAGALGIRLGGTLSYSGRTEHRPVLNPLGRPVQVADIGRAVGLSRRIGVLALAASIAGRSAARALVPPRSDASRDLAGHRRAGGGVDGAARTVAGPVGQPAAPRRGTR